MKQLTTRIIVAVFGIPVLIFCIWQGNYWFFAAIVIMTLLGQYELYDLMREKDVFPQIWPGLALTLLMLYIIGYGAGAWTVSMGILLILFIMGAEMFRNIGSPLLNTAGTFMGPIYPGLFLGSMLYLRFHVGDLFGAHQVQAAAVFIITIFVSVWICDTMAYFVGVTLGKHRLFERVSPKKSIEGAIAGIVGAVLVFMAIRWLNLLDMPYSFLIISGLIVGSVGQFGDLVESWLKRDADVKDSSHILPGHGGFLDRFDSLSYISPAFLIVFLLWK